MPYSIPENNKWISQKIKEINPKTVLDVGCGAGRYLDIVRNILGSEVIVDAIEIWTPYIWQFNLIDRYNTLFNTDARTHKNYNYDLVILGDIIEHMEEKEAVKLWNKIKKQAKYAVISLPIIHAPQDAYMGNPYEVHVEEDWNAERVLKSFSNIIDYEEYNITGSFLAKFI